jgi:hypothetical protein
MTASRRVVPLLLALLAACGGNDPSGPSGGSLAVSVSGLPGGTAASVSVTGPGGYSHDVSSTETLTGLSAGSYTVSADAVISGGQSYQPAVPVQTVAVAGATVTANVVYGLAGGSLTVNVAGLPPATAAAVHVGGPNGYATDITQTTTLSGLSPAMYTVTAQSVSPGGTTYNPSPGSQVASVANGGNTTANVSYTGGAAGGFNLRIDGLYLTQSVQTYTGAVPLVKDRDGYLRVFVTASQSNLATPQVRVRFYQSSTLVSTLTIAPPGVSVPLSPNEGNLTSSWNVRVPKSLIQPGLSVLADVDPDNAIAESDEADNQFPTSGTPLALDVHTTPTFSVRFVPVLQSVNGRLGNVTNANKDSYLIATMKMHPLAAYDADLRAPFTTGAAALDATNSTTWTKVLSQVDALRAADGSSRYYFGVVSPPYNSGIAGIGYITGQTALGWDKNGADLVAAHEWGHNWGRSHSPCGSGISGTDPNYPYPGGSIGVYGLDVAALSLKPPTYTDIMGYCNNEWISDYTYVGVLAYRGSAPDVAADFAQATQPCLLVWGRIEDGQPVLEPAFQIVTRPSLPARPGPFSVEGRDASGSRVFHLSFTPQMVADDPHGGQHFAFAVPLQPDRAARLDAIQLNVPGRAPVSLRAAAASGAVLDLRAVRAGPGRVSIQWNASAHPMVMVRDPGTGQVLSFASGGSAEIATEQSDLEVQLSNGVAGRSVRVAVPAR